MSIVEHNKISLIRRFFRLEGLNYKRLFDSISEGLMAVDKELKITFFNEIASEITGWSFKEVAGKKCYEIFRNSLCPKNCLFFKTTEQFSSCFQSGVLIRNKYGRTVPLKISTMPLKDENKEFQGVIFLFSDQRELYPTNLENFHQLGLIGSSKQMREVFQLIETVAETEANVLILGKTGTGKELVANAIHKLSPRCNKPFVKVNCAALSDSLLESELFGHERGAFTGAINRRIGRFEEAHTGSIFLDEIAEISPQFQAKLLRVIQEGEFERVGSSKTIKVDIRLIAATNKDLEKLVKQNLFRDDLFYRLNVFPIYLPELKDRKGDLKSLIDYFINKFNMIYRKQKQGISEDALSLLYNYDFPGNIRELRNIIEHAFIKSPGIFIEKEHLPAFLLGKSLIKQQLIDHRQEKELDYIHQVLEDCNGNKSKAAKILGISRKTLYNKLNAVSINKKL